MPTSVTSISAAKTKALRYLASLRPQDILVLQGSPLLGAAVALRDANVEDLGPLVVLMLANVLLVAHVFTLNDWAGLTSDLADSNKAAKVFTVRGVARRGMGRLTIALLAVSLLLFGTLGLLPFAIALGIAVLSGLYSLPRFHWKGRPFLNTVAHLAGGTLHFLLGYSLGGAIDARGVATATFFALIFAAGHLTQEIRDHRGDALNAIRTNAVAFGPRRTFAASLILFTLAHVLLFLLAFRGILPRAVGALIALFFLQLYWSARALRDGLTFASVSRLQSRYRLLYAVIGVAMVTALLVS